MRRIALALAALLLLAPVAGARADEGAAPDPAAARSEIIRVITDSYVDGIHNFRDPEAIRRGFHPEFEMLFLRDGHLAKLPIADWIARIEAQNAKEAPPAREGAARTTEARFERLEIAGDAAVVRLELWREGKHVFTDFLSLYHFSDGWKIVGKTYYRHP
ncbi:MAG: nuclear transport factor 2 family protein [Thermoanaerobaculia bacterium]|nr:nuclear transport factor 2 family protein [Thermoanaerobaculia bacterium]MCZ7650321.1 nuclear transport factor 2 family protein [Thermoanaerobaculia bacterium]